MEPGLALGVGGEIPSNPVQLPLLESKSGGRLADLHDLDWRSQEAVSCLIKWEKVTSVVRLAATAITRFQALEKHTQCIHTMLMLKKYSLSSLPYTILHPLPRLKVLTDTVMSAQE